MKHHNVDGGGAVSIQVKDLKPLKTPVLSSESELDSIVVQPPTSVPTVVGLSVSTDCGSDPYMAFIYQKESGCSTTATNASSGAYGLCQSLPGYKMASAGDDWQTNWDTQNTWCINYANQRYGSPYLAMVAWQNQGWW